MEPEWQRNWGVRTTDRGGSSSAIAESRSISTRPLSPKVEGILLAAQRILLRDGYGGLTIRRIADEAGENSSVVMYHFGGKAQLMALLADSLWHHEDVQFAEALPALPTDARTRVSALIHLHARFTRDERLYRMYYELLPHISRHAKMRRLAADIYASYREDIGVRCLEPTPLPAAQRGPLATLLLAIGEGLPIQILLAPSSVDQDACFGYLEGMVIDLVQHAGTGERHDRATEGGSRPPLRELLAGDCQPAVRLPRPAENILQSAIRVTRQKGVNALTLDAVALTSGQPRSSVSYYFGSKQGLLAATLDAIVADSSATSAKRLRAVASQGLTAFVPLAGARSVQRAVIELLPVALRDQQLRRALAAHYDWRRNSMDAAFSRPLASPAARSVRSTLAVAALDGLVMQAMLGLREFNPAPALAVLDVVGELVREDTQHGH